MANKVGSLWFGLVLVFWGFITIKRRTYFSSRNLQTVDWGPGHGLIGALMIALGICLVVDSLRRKQKAIDQQDKEHEKHND